MYDSKVCFKCNVLQPLSEFYKHKQMADGHLNKCKSCNKKDVKENYAKNIDYYKEYEKSRFNKPHRIEARLKYSQTEIGKQSIRQSKIKWSEDNVIKKAASYTINRAIKSGRISKSLYCESCGAEHKRLHGHHDDYDYPLKVRWLCPKCHTSWHKENGSGLNG